MTNRRRDDPDLLDAAGVAALHLNGLTAPLARALDTIADALRARAAEARRANRRAKTRVVVNAIPETVTLLSRTRGLALTLVVDKPTKKER